MGSFEGPSTNSGAGGGGSPTSDGPKSGSGTYKNTFGGKNHIANNFMDALDAISPVDEPWFLSSNSTSTSSLTSPAGSNSSSSSSSSSGGSSSIWPSLSRPRDGADNLSSFPGGVRKGYYSNNTRVISSPTRKFVFRTFQILSVLICAFGTYTLVINVISLTRSSSQLEFYNNSTTITTTTTTNNNNLNTNNLHEQLKTWLFYRNNQRASPNSINSDDSSSSSNNNYNNYNNYNNVNINVPKFRSRSNDKTNYASLLDIQDFYFILNNVSICDAKSKSSKKSQPGEGILAPTPSLEPEEPGVLGEGIYFMIIVHSARGHFAERQAIRSTWGSVKTLKNWAIRLVFLLGSSSSNSDSDSLVGKSIFRESAIFGDIVTGNFQDTYKNLTYKHLMGYKWALNFCPGATFVLKTDDDAFIDIFQLFDFISRTYGFNPENTLLCNVFPEGTKPVRFTDAMEVDKKWAVTREEYPHDTYPKYCGGLAYLITPDVLREILSVSENSRFFWVDDVYVTGVLRELVEKEPFYLNLRYSYTPADYRKWLRDRKRRKIPFMIVHVERGAKFTEEMDQMWRKTMRIWS